MEYETKEEASEYLIGRFVRSGLAPTVSTEVGNHLVTGFEEVTLPDPPPGALAMMVPRIRWVIRNDDLSLLDAVSDAVMAALTTGWVVGVSPVAQPNVAGVAAIAAASLRVLNQIRRKGAQISDRGMKLLVALDSSERPLSREDIAEGLDSLSQKELADTFEELQKVRLRDGTVVSLISQDATGRWSVAGV
jgi:hypothetical protein